MKKSTFFCTVLFSLTILNSVIALDISVAGDFGLGFWVGEEFEAIEASGEYTGLSALILPSPEIAMIASFEAPLKVNMYWGLAIGIAERSGAIGFSDDDLGILRVSVLNIASTDILGVLSLRKPFIKTSSLALSLGAGLGFAVIPLTTTIYLPASRSSEFHELDVLERIILPVRLGGMWELPVWKGSFFAGIKLDCAFATFDLDNSSQISILPSVGFVTGYRYEFPRAASVGGKND